MDKTVRLPLSAQERVCDVLFDAVKDWLTFAGLRVDRPAGRLDVVDGEVLGDDLRTTTAIESVVYVPRRVLPPVRGAGSAGRRVMIGWTYPDVVTLLETVRAAPTVTVCV